MDEVRAFPGTAVVSMEYLGPVRPQVAERVVQSFAGARVEVVVTARDLNRTLAAMWQETVQNGRSWTWTEYLDGVRTRRPGAGGGTTDRTSPGGTFWRQQDLVRISRKWARFVGPERVCLVTVPPAGADRETLMRRFADAAGFDAAGLVGASSDNESLGLASTLALRRLNELLDERGVDASTGPGLRKHQLAKTVLAARRAVEPWLGLPVHAWVRAQAGETVAGLHDLGVSLVGEWSDLTPVPLPGIDPGDVPAEQVAEAALAGLAGVLEHATAHPRRRRRVRSATRDGAASSG